MSTTQRINAAEKDLEKFIKFLTLKSVQVVVQSRLGEKFQTQCNPLATGNDWFNIVINDHPDVAAETKHALGMKAGDTILQRLPLSVEISLKTVDGDQMILEVWSIDLQPPPREYNKDIVDATTVKGLANNEQLIKASHAIYNRMGILLKSLITLTRTTPAYKLSRRQCPDSYDIYYRIYVDRPQLHNLGEGYKQVRIGQLNTIVGTLSMSVAYRTKMTFTPTAGQNRNGESNAIMVKSDHFRPNSESTAAPKPSVLAAVKKTNGVGATTERKVIDIEKPLRPGAFTDVAKLRHYTEEDYMLPETPPFEWLLRQTRNDSSNGSVESLNCKCESPITITTGTTTSTTTPFGNGYQQHINIANNNNNSNINNYNTMHNNNNNNTHALNQNLQNYNNNNNNNNNKNDSGDQLSSRLSQSPIKSLLVPMPPSSKPIAIVAKPNATQCDDDNLLKELNFPFASSTSHVNDLAKFYRDCYHAPPLLGLSEIMPANETENNTSSNSSNNSANNLSSITCGATAFATATDSAAVDDLSRQLEQFETSLEDYDKLVSQFGLSNSSSTTGSRSSGGLQMSN